MLVVHVGKQAQCGSVTRSRSQSLAPEHTEANSSSPATRGWQLSFPRESQAPGPFLSHPGWGPQETGPKPPGHASCRPGLLLGWAGTAATAGSWSPLSLWAASAALVLDGFLRRAKLG